eukprot:m51a1_g13023 hypothetical protein (143) ;mRNA; f:494-2438
MPISRSPGSYGDLVVRFRIAFPAQLSDSQRQRARELFRDVTDPKSKWVFEQRDGSIVCIKNVATNKYLYVPDKGVTALSDSCDGDRAAWDAKITLVEDRRGIGWTFRSIHRDCYLCAHADDTNWISVDRKVDDTWEHFQITR